MILVLGARGQVAKALAETGLLRPLKVVGSEAFDLRETSKVQPWLEALAPTAILNAAAYTKVDLAETEVEAARALNAELPEVLARYASEAGIPLIHYSTDYVYPGEGTAPHKVGDPVAPHNVYGRTKLEGEEAIRASGCLHAILRTSWVYDESGQNFLRTMLKLGAEREELRVVADQIGAPTWAHDLALVSWQVLDAKNWGTHHACGLGETSWHGFALEIFAQARALDIKLKVERVLPVPSSEYKTAARRPLNSRMSESLIKKTWQTSLSECLRRIKNETH